jgi:hypothetical protein
MVVHVLILIHHLLHKNIHYIFEVSRSIDVTILCCLSRVVVTCVDPHTLGRTFEHPLPLDSIIHTRHVITHSRCIPCPLFMYI